MKHIDIYWSEDGTGSPCDYLISSKGQLTAYIDTNRTPPATHHIVFQRPAPGWHTQSYHQLWRLIAGRPDWAVKFHGFPDMWW